MRVTWRCGTSNRSRVMSATQLSTRTFAAGRAEAGLAGKGDTAVVPTARADVAGVAAVGIAAQDQALDNLADGSCFATAKQFLAERGIAVGALVSGDFVFEAQVAPAVPVVAEERVACNTSAEAVVGGGMVGVAPGGPGLSAVEG